MLSHSSPQGAGFDPAKLDYAFRMVEGWIGEGTVSGAAVLVARRGRIARTRAYGHLSRDDGSPPVQADTAFAVASITKVVTAVTLLKHVDEGKIALDTPVREVLPEWTTPGVEGITFRHLLSHTSGLPEDLPRDALNYEDRNSLDVIIDAFMRLRPEYAPGERLIYSNAGMGIVGRAIERLTGKSYREAVWRTVLGPLWMNDTWFGNPPAGRENRVAVVYGTDRPGTDLDPYNGSYFRALAHPWGGMFSTVEDVAKLAQVFLDNGLPLLDVGTALAATRNLTNGLHGGFANWPGFPTGDWALGWEVKGARGRHWTGERTSHATFGHVGGAGGMVWADPMRDLICVVLANRVISGGWPVTRPQRRWETFSDAVVEAIVNSE